MKTVFHKILGILFPERCLGCNVADTLLCDSCLRKLPRYENEAWKVSRMYALFDYRNPLVRKLVLKLKYSGKSVLGEALGKVMGEELTALLEDLVLFENFKEPLIIPVPVSALRLKERGFNQAQVLAEGLAESYCDVRIEFSPALLQKIRETGSQTKTKSRRERLAGPKGSFAATTPEKISERNIIVIDDVITTGATMKEAMRVLKEAGARSVIGFALAH